VNLLGDSIATINNNMEEIGLEINIEKTKYMLPSSHQNAGQDINGKQIT
jgi:hypothetical protein